MRYRKLLTFFLPVILIIGILIYVFFNRYKIFNRQNTNKNSVLNKNTKQEFCSRLNPFNINQEFNNALNLIEQRSKNAERLENTGDISSTNIQRYFPALDSRKCLDVFYSDRIPNLKNSGAWFDTNNSTQNHLIIKINPEYQNQKINNLVMAMLLAHELSHVEQFLGLRSEVKLTCIQQEAYAFLSEYRFLSILTQEEQPKVMDLAKTTYYPILGTFYDLVIQSDKASTPCNELQQGKQFNQNEFNICFWDKMETVAEDYIKTIPGYQEHCKLK